MTASTVQRPADVLEGWTQPAGRPGTDSVAVQERRNVVKGMIAQGYSQSDIAEITRLSTRTIARHATAPESAARKVYRKNPIKEPVTCVVCKQTVCGTGLRYKQHNTEDGGAIICDGYLLPIPLAHIIRPAATAWWRRVKQVAALATHIQEANVDTIDTYLAGVDRDELEAIARFALAAIPTDRTEGQLWPKWTRKLRAE